MDYAPITHAEAPSLRATALVGSQEAAYITVILVMVVSCVRLYTVGIVPQLTTRRSSRPSRGTLAHEPFRHAEYFRQSDVSDVARARVRKRVGVYRVAYPSCLLTRTSL